jgi:hypothetical protein
VTELSHAEIQLIRQLLFLRPDATVSKVSWSPPFGLAAEELNRNGEQCLGF